MLLEITFFAFSLTEMTNLHNWQPIRHWLHRMAMTMTKVKLRKLMEISENRAKPQQIHATTCPLGSSWISIYSVSEKPPCWLKKNYLTLAIRMGEPTSLNLWFWAVGMHVTCIAIRNNVYTKCTQKFGYDNRYFVANMDCH